MASINKFLFSIAIRIFFRFFKHMEVYNIDHNEKNSVQVIVFFNNPKHHECYILETFSELNKK